MNYQKNLTVKQNLIVYGKLYNVLNINKRIEYLVEKLRLSDLLNRVTGELSSGQKNRVSLAKALINNPIVLFLMNQQLLLIQKLVILLEHF